MLAIIIILCAATLLRALAGLLICAGIMTILFLLIIALVWYMIRSNLDFDDIANMESPEKSDII